MDGRKKAEGFGEKKKSPLRQRANKVLTRRMIPPGSNALSHTGTRHRFLTLALVSALAILLMAFIPPHVYAGMHVQEGSVIMLGPALVMGVRYFKRLVLSIHGIKPTLYVNEKGRLSADPPLSKPAQSFINARLLKHLENHGQTFSRLSGLEIRFEIMPELFNLDPEGKVLTLSQNRTEEYLSENAEPGAREY